MIGDRVWEQGTNGLWSSREANDEDKARQAVFERWHRKEITYKELREELGESDD